MLHQLGSDWQPHTVISHNNDSHNQCCCHPSIFYHYLSFYWCKKKKNYNSLTHTLNFDSVYWLLIKFLTSKSRFVQKIIISGVTVALKCNKGKKLAYALTDEKGFFQAELPLSPSSSSSSPNCLARLLGGPKKLCSFKKNLVSKIVKAKDHDAYTISTPFTTFSTCPPNHSSYASKAKDPKIADTRAYGKSGGENGEFKSSKTVDLPLPPEWGFPPTSYYTPFIPIIGIP